MSNKLVILLIKLILEPQYELQQRKEKKRKETEEFTKIDEDSLTTKLHNKNSWTLFTLKLSAADWKVMKSENVQQDGAFVNKAQTP